MQNSLIHRILFVHLAVFICSAAQGATLRTQEITLKAGWNAIFVEVDPVESAPSKVFDPAIVDVVARYVTPAASVRFIQDPDEQPWNAPGWAVYYAPDRAESFLTSLHAIQGGYACLVHALKDATVAVTGEVRFNRLSWMVDSYNLTGFPVDNVSPPTFARFFAGAGGKLGSRVYRLVAGSWQKVTDLASTTIRSGEACWVYCEGSTTYQGPLELRFSGLDLDFGKTGSQLTIEYANQLGTPCNIIAAVEGNDGLPLYRTVIDLTKLTSSSTPMTGSTSLGTLPTAGVSQLHLELRRELMTAVAGSAVLKLATSDGVALRIPVRAAAP